MMTREQKIQVYKALGKAIRIVYYPPKEKQQIIKIMNELLKEINDERHIFFKKDVN